MKIKRLNFGAGEDIKEGWDNCDLDNHCGANITFNADKFPYPLRSNTYD